MIFLRVVLHLIGRIFKNSLDSSLLNRIIYSLIVFSSTWVGGLEERFIRHQIKKWDQLEEGQLIPASTSNWG
jgi:hypothetical protein